MIQIENVKRNYRTGETVVKALRGITLEIAQGEFISIAGKTTLLNLIGCIDRADSGEIFINRQAVSAKKNKELALFRFVTPYP